MRCVVSRSLGCSQDIHTKSEFAQPASKACEVAAVASIYSLIECPAPSAASYVLVKRHADGSRDILGSGRAVAEAPSVNLAIIRERGAKLGANEVHLGSL
jgi:hypothetical protein